MPDDSSGFFSNLRSYATEYVETKRRNLQAKPQTQVEGGGGNNTVSFAGQDISQKELRDVKQMRESGGIISQVFHSKALIKFGTGTELQAEDDDLEEWLQENVGPIDDVVSDLGEDSLWYPYGLGEVVETQGGKFSHIELIEPWTMLPQTDEFGDIIAWQQHLKGEYSNPPTFQPDEIGSIIINKSSGRDKTGISEALRSQEEIETFRANQQAMREATERIGFPFVHAKAGREGATQLNDNELRRIRNRLAQIGPGETQVTGPDVDIDLKDPATVDFGAIQERDMRMLATSLGVPVELLNHGSDGLGSGMPAELRKDLLALQNEADRRRFSEQFVEEFLRPIVRKYSPFDHTMEMHVEFEPFLDDKTDMASLISSVGEYMTANEAREKMGLSKLDDEEKGESFRTPEDIESPDDQPDGGLFGSDGRELAEIPDKYTEDTGLSEDDFVPNESILDVIEPTMEFIDKEGLPNPDDQQEGAARINQLKDHIDNNEPLAPEFWEEIANFHSRHRAQGNNECDESSLPEKAEEVDFDKCHFDNGWFSNRTWGGDPAFEQAQRIVESIEDTEGVELSGDVPDYFLAGDMDFRKLQVPDNAVSISDRSEAPEDAEIVEGKRGGLYYIPSKDSGQRDDLIDAEDVKTPDESVPDQSEIPSDIVDTEELGFDVPEDRLRGDDFMNVGVVAWDMDDNEAVSVDPEVLHFNEPQLDGENIQGILDADPDELPPLEGYQTSDGQVVVTDGNHRAAAAKIAGWDEMDMKIVDNDDVEGVELSDVNTDGWEDWEHTLYELHQQAFEADGDVRLANFTERALPDFVKDRLQESIMQGAIFSQFDTLVENDIMQLREFMTEELTQNDGWTTDSIAGRLMDLESELTRDEAERIARTETASIVNSAREDGYEAQNLTDGEKFYWTGATQAQQPDRTTDACDWLINKTNPNHGGDPVSLEKLKELIEEAPKHDDEMQDNLARPEDFVVHPNERKTWVRAV